jgi:hypothetical protein
MKKKALQRSEIIQNMNFLKRSEPWYVPHHCMHCRRFTLKPVYTCCDFRCDFLLLDVNEWMSYECSDEGAYTQNIRNSFTCSHASDKENRTRNRDKNYKCKRAFNYG